MAKYKLESILWCTPTDNDHLCTFDSDKEAWDTLRKRYFPKNNKYMTLYKLVETSVKVVNAENYIASLSEKHKSQYTVDDVNKCDYWLPVCRGLTFDEYDE